MRHFLQLLAEKLIETKKHGSLLEKLQVFSKELQKVSHFVKKCEKSSIWPKLATFRANYHVFAFGSPYLTISSKQNPKYFSEHGQS